MAAQDFNYTVNKLDFMKVCRFLHPTSREHTFFQAHNDNILTHKASLNKLK